MLGKLQDLFTNCWEKGTLPEDLRDVVIISLYKNMGEKSDFKLPRQHPTLHCRENLGWCLAEQAHPNNSTGKHARKPVWDRHDLCAATESGEMQGKDRSVYTAFKDLTKAFDTVNCDGLWKILARLG